MTGVIALSSDLEARADRLAIMCESTPTVLIERTSGCAIWAKLDYQHPSGSTKDRVAARIVSHGVASGRITADTLVVEASSGSMSISLAMACALIEVRFVAVMPANVSSERSAMIRSFGADVILTDPDAAMGGAIREVESIAAGSTDVFWPRQFENPLNADAHATTTAEELLAQVPGALAAFVAGVGTGGTLTGIARALRTAVPGVVIAQALPVDRNSEPSAAIPGVVDGYSRLMTAQPPDRIARVRADDAVAATRELIARGFPVGPSSGLNLAAARRIANDLGSGRIATIFPDRMERYLSTDLFAESTGR